MFLSCMIQVTVFSKSSVLASQPERSVGSAPTKQELLQCWTEYLYALGSVEGTGKYFGKANGKIFTDTTVHMVYLYPCLLEFGSSKKHVNSFGKQYDFSLTRDNPTLPWTIERLEFKQDHRDLKSWDFPKHGGGSQDDSVGYDIFNTIGVGLFADKSTPNLPDIFKSKHLKILKMEAVENEGKKQTLLEFEYSCYDDTPGIIPQHEPTYKQIFYLKAEVTLETDYYLISRGKFQAFRFRLDGQNDKVNDEWESDVECEFDTTTYRVPLPKHYKRITRNPSILKSTPNISEYTIDLDLRETHPKDPKRFTLSAFGLPEPDFGPRRMSLFRIVMMSLGGILVLLALWLMYLKRL